MFIKFDLLMSKMKLKRVLVFVHPIYVFSVLLVKVGGLRGLELLGLFYLKFCDFCVFTTTVVPCFCVQVISLNLVVERSNSLDK